MKFIGNLGLDFSVAKIFLCGLVLFLFDSAIYSPISYKSIQRNGFSVVRRFGRRSEDHLNKNIVGT